MTQPDKELIVKMLQHFIFLLLFVAPVLVGDDVQIPPYITSGPPLSYTYRDSEDVTLTCLATGSPRPRFDWRKNDLPVDPNDPSIKWLEPSISGSIVLLAAKESQMGYYQCLATNAYGVAVSNVSFIQMATLERFPVTTTPAMKYVPAGESLYLPCDQLKSVPSVVYSWALAQNMEDNTPQLYVISERVQIDDLGYLRFAYVQKEDEMAQKLYKCVTFNPVLDITQGGSYAAISVTGTSINSSIPRLSFSTEPPLIGLQGESVKMRCLFSGNPVPKLGWKKENGTLPPPSRWLPNAALFNTEVLIKNLELGDAGNYSCTGSSPIGSAHATINLQIAVRPKFLPSMSHLSSRNVTDGESATFTCIADAIPVADVTWYRNNEKLKKDSLPPKYHINDDGLSLTISQLCKDCPDSSVSLAVIQCNASNVHGYAFAQGSINVFLKTEILDSSSTVVWEPKKTVTFPCHAKSDPMTPVRHEWFFNDNKLPNDSNVYFNPSEQMLYIVTENDADGGLARAGKYHCVATNGYSSATVEHFLNNQSAVTASMDLWWIALIIALIIVIIILLILAWVLYRQNRGDSYPVDEKERLHGTAAEGFLDEEFHEYQRIENQGTLGKSKSSLAGVADASQTMDEA